MRRIARRPRPDAAARLEAQGLSFHGRDAYWNEGACYEFTLAEVEELEAAAAELHELSVGALRFLAVRDRLGELGIDPRFREALAASLSEGQFSLYGRFDLAYDGISSPKLLEYNADTPTALIEAAVCQWFWLRECEPQADQFNSLHEKLIARWRDLPTTAPVHLASIIDHEEDWACVAYLADTLVQAGHQPRMIHVHDIGWDPDSRYFVDLAGDRIDTLFKLYPWEWLLAEDFGIHVLDSRTRFVEPLWKAALSSKGLLPVLWELNPGHPNLLPAFSEPADLGSYARKPLFSREGANVSLYVDGRPIAESDGPYGREGFVYQALASLPCLDGRYPVIGAWLVNGEPAGMGIRESATPITTDQSSFVPHYFVD